MRIAITGASGHIGCNLSRELLKKGYLLRLMVNNYSASLEGLNAEFVSCDLLKRH